MWRTLMLLVLLALLPRTASAQAPFPFADDGPVERLSSSDAEVRAEAARELGRWGEPRRAVAALAEALRQERDVAVRRELVRSLALRGDPVAVPTLVDALGTPGSMDRAAVAIALGAFDNDAAVRALVGALTQDDVREPAHHALARIGPRAVPHLLRALRNPATRLSALRALGTIGDRRATPAIVELLAADADQVRVAALRALEDIADERSGPAVFRLLGHESDVVRVAALRALARVGSPAHASAVRPLVGAESPAVARAALRALGTLDPPLAMRLAEEAVAQGTAVLAPAAVELALETTHPRVISLLYGLALEGTRGEEAASALAEVEGGAGIPVLVELAATEGGIATGAARALAVGLRRWGAELDGDLRGRGWELLSQSSEDARRRLVLRALARDPDVGEVLIASLRAEDASLRATAAFGLELLGDPSVDTGALARALAEEPDPEAWRRMAAAAAALGVKVDFQVLRPHLDDPARMPEAMALGAISFDEAASDGAGRRARRSLAIAMRRALRHEEPRVRAGAARALGLAGDRGAWRALVERLRDPLTEVRLATARALEALAVEEASELLRAHGRAERDLAVADALLDAAEAPWRRPYDPRALEGTQVLRVRIVIASGARAGVPVDIVLPDGRWLRMRTLPTGELVVPDLPSGTADVRVRIGG